ncbi:MAG: hypothetical protein ACI8QZ_004128 [Chlamydiales bacterium]|jgi:hypothetical protein
MLCYLNTAVPERSNGVVNAPTPWLAIGALPQPRLTTSLAEVASYSRLHPSSRVRKMRSQLGKPSPLLEVRVLPSERNRWHDPGEPSGWYNS